MGRKYGGRDVPGTVYGDHMVEGVQGHPDTRTDST